MCVNRGGSGGGGGSLEEAHQKTWDSLTDHERSLLYDYTDTGYERINGHLLGDEAPTKEMRDSTISDIHDMDALLAKTSLPSDMVVYRGVTLDGYEYMAAQGMFAPGAVWEHKNFISASGDLDVAKSFTGFEGGTADAPRNVFMLKVPKGSKGIYIGRNSAAHVDEKELILPRGLKVRTGNSWVEKKKVFMGNSYTRITELEVVR